LENKSQTNLSYFQRGRINLRSKRPRQSCAAVLRLERPGLTGMYQCCSMDFMSDQLFNGKKFRIFTLVDNFSRERLALQCGQSLKGRDIVTVLEDLRVNQRILPKRIQSENGSEFISKELGRLAYEN
jgi:putative transposase